MWEGLDEDTRAQVIAAPEPSTDANTGLADTTWLALFYPYLVANGADATTLNGVIAADAINRDESVETLFALVNTDGSNPFPISDDLYPRMAFPTSSDRNFIPDQLRTEIAGALAPWWTAFVDEATRMRHWDGRQGLIEEWESHADPNASEEERQGTTGMPVHTTMSVDDLDRDYVDSLNEYELKALEEGETTTFVQMDDVVLIGGNFPPAYTQAVDGAGTRSKSPTNGKITMVAKGSTFSSGKLEVVFTGPFPDPDNAKVALRRVTKKSISFG